MVRSLLPPAVSLLFACVPLAVAYGQLGGSRAGVENRSADGLNLPQLTREIAESYIAIDGRAEIRARPTEIRMVLAVTGQGETAQACRLTVDETAQRLQAAWSKAGIKPQNIVEDFIAVLPRYEWKLERRGDVDVGVEEKAGFRMQTNLHLALPDESKAQEMLRLAFEQGVTDIIAFDYWSGALDEIKVKAREQALQAAVSKAGVLFAALFAKPPPVINVQEQTTVHYPDSLYHSFTNSEQEDAMPAGRRDVPFIRASRPRNTYYRGLYSNADVQARDLPMKPEITVISTVRIYYRSPACQPTKEQP